MRVFVMTDAESRITGVNPNDMSGNSGWIETTDTALTAHTGVGYDDMFSRLSEEHGVSLYKFMDGYGVHRTAEEIAADIAAIPPPEPTPQDDTDALLADHEERLIYMELGV